MALTILAIGLIAGLSSVATLAISCVLFLLCRRNASRSQRTKPASERKCYRLTITNLADLAKPRQSVTITAIPPDPEKGWVPQIREVHELGKYNAASRYSLGGPRSLATPPPAYQPKARGSQSDSLSNKKMISPPCLKTDFSRDTGAVSSPFCVSPVTPILLSPNPRTASFSSKVSLTSPSLRSGVAASISNSALPRNMLVCSTFTPTRDDEMLITVGESLRVLEQFEDHWSLVQRDGSEDAELGVVPTHCLVGLAYAGAKVHTFGD